MPPWEPLWDSAPPPEGQGLSGSPPAFALIPVNVGSMSLTRCLAQIDKGTSPKHHLFKYQSVESITPSQAFVFILLLIQWNFLSWHPHTACWWLAL